MIYTISIEWKILIYLQTFNSLVFRVTGGPTKTNAWFCDPVLGKRAATNRHSLHHIHNDHLPFFLAFHIRKSNTFESIKMKIPRLIDFNDDWKFQWINRFFLLNIWTNGRQIFIQRRNVWIVRGALGPSSIVIANGYCLILSIRLWYYILNDPLWIIYFILYINGKSLVIYFCVSNGKKSTGGSFVRADRLEKF